MALVAVPSIAGIGCSHPSGPQRLPLNPKLSLVLTGEPVLHPVWLAPEYIYAYTGVVPPGGPLPISGIFRLHIDPTNFSLRAAEPFEFSDDLWTLTPTDSLGDIIGIHMSAPGQFQASYLDLVGDQVMVAGIIAGAAREPWGVALWPGRGVIYYGLGPAAQPRGFYRHGTGSPDSLIFAVALSDYEARGMAVSHDGRYLYFGTGTPSATFFRFDLTVTGASAEIIAQRIGRVVGVATHPSTYDLLISYMFPGDASSPPQGHIELLVMNPGQSADLDVRTLPFSSQYPTNDHPTWSPDGRHFAFSAGGFDGEGAHYLPELWIYRDVP